MKDGKIFVRRNEQIRVPRVLVIKDEQKIGEMPTFEAIKLAREASLDLVEVAPQARPPVCHITDYGKYTFDLKKKLKNQLKGPTVKEKEVKFHYVISDHDLQTKINQIKRIIEQGDKVKIVLEFRGRENQQRDVGFALITKCLDQLKEIVKVDNPPSFQGKCLIAKVSKL